MNLIALLANLALIKVIYVIFFLILVVVINVLLSRRKNKNEDESPNADIYITDHKVCCDSLDSITSKN